MIIHMIDSLSDHGITLRLYRFGISSSAGKMASREVRNISCHPQAAKQPHGAVIGMHRPRLSRYNRTLAQSDLVSLLLLRSLSPPSSRSSSSLTSVSSLSVRNVNTATVTATS